jgi:hypothetical protein
MDYQLGGSIVFLFLFAIALFGYAQSAQRAEALDRRRRNVTEPDGRAERYVQR